MSVAENRPTVLIVESSEIVQAGLTRILSESVRDVKIFNLFTIEELEHYCDKKDVSLIIINPGIVSGCASGLVKLLEKFPQAKALGLITNYYDRTQMLLFADNIFISDDSQDIGRIVKNNLSLVTHKEFLSRQLTSRELEVLKLLVNGYSNKQIADRLFISIHTVVTHRRNISEKLGIKSLAGLAVYGVINNIIDVTDYLKTIR